MNTLLRSTLRVATCAALFLLLTPAAPAAVYTIPTADPFSRGWYDGTGFHSLDRVFTDNYFAGRNGEEYRNFFIFSLPVLAPGETIVDGSLALHARLLAGSDPGGYDSHDPTETYQVFSLDRTSISALRAGGIGRTDIFADLGDGISYSTGTVMSSASKGTDVIIPLNAAFLAYAVANLGGEISMGGAVTSLGPVNLEDAEGVFGDSGGVGLSQTRLTINTVLVPSLSIVRLDAARAQLTWATNFPNHVLEYATRLPAMSWDTVTNGIVTAGARFSITVDTDAALRLFRLRKL